MRMLIVFLKDTFYAGIPGAAQWHSSRHEDPDRLQEVLLDSGALVVYRLNPEHGTPQAHLGGERADRVAFFPHGGWSGYTWETIDEAALARAAAAASGIATPR